VLCCILLFMYISSLAYIHHPFRGLFGYLVQFLRLIQFEQDLVFRRNHPMFQMEVRSSNLINVDLRCLSTAWLGSQKKNSMTWLLEHLNSLA
jgi:hypothetical protein